MQITTTTKITQELLDDCGDNLFPKSSKLRIYGTAAFAIVAGVILLAFAFSPDGFNQVFAVIAGVLMIAAGSLIYNMRSLTARYVKSAKIGIKEQFEDGKDYVEEQLVFEDNRLKVGRTGNPPSSAITIEYEDITRFEEVCCQNDQAVFIVQSLSGNTAFVSTCNLTDEEDKELMKTLKASRVKVRRRTKRNKKTE